MPISQTSQRLLLCLMIAAMLGLFCQKAHAYWPGRVDMDPYDPAIDAQIKNIAHDLQISDFEEHPIDVPGLAAPVGLDISFKVSQTLGSNFSIALGVSDKSAPGLSCLKAESKYSNIEHVMGIEIYSIKGEAQKILHYHCLPLGRAWNEGKPLDEDGHVLDSLALLEHAPGPAPNTRLGLSLGISITNPNCESFRPLVPKPDATGYICRRYGADISDKLPANLTLDNGTFWHNAVMQSLPNAIVATGRYVLCDARGFYCSKK